MKRKINIFKNIFIKMSVIFLFISTCISVSSANVNVYISDEVGGATLQDRVNVDALDDVWRVAASSASSTASTTFFTSVFNTPTSMTVAASNTVLSVGVSLQNMTSVLDVNNMGTANATQGNLVSSSLDMQDSSPKPQSFVNQNYWNEQAGSTVNRNGLKITFKTGVRSAGLYIGDFETRTSGGGTAGLVRLYDTNGNFISENIVNPNASTNQSLCGAPVNDSFIGCGNRTTRYVGFVADQNTLVGSMILIVGDDDTSSGTDNGNTEHFSFTGLTFVEYIAKIIEPVATTTPTTTPITPTSTPTTTEPVATSTPTTTSTTTVSTTTPTSTSEIAIPQTIPNYGLAPLGLIDPNIYSVNTEIINKSKNTKKLSSLLPTPPSGYEYCNDEKDDCIDAENVFKKQDTKKLEKEKEEKNIEQDTLKHKNKISKSLPATGDSIESIFNIYNYDNFQDVYIMLAISILIIMSRLKYLIKV
jgi:hypothetical protein